MALGLLVLEGFWVQSRGAVSVPGANNLEGECLCAALCGCGHGFRGFFQRGRNGVC